MLTDPALHGFPFVHESPRPGVVKSFDNVSCCAPNPKAVIHACAVPEPQRAFIDPQPLAVFTDVLRTDPLRTSDDKSRRLGIYFRIWEKPNLVEPEEELI